MDLLEELGKFRTVVVDPPWPLTKTGARSGRDEVSHGDLGYEPMSLADIFALPIEEVLDQHAFVFLWTTQRFRGSEKLGSQL